MSTDRTTPTNEPETPKGGNPVDEPRDGKATEATDDDTAVTAGVVDDIDIAGTGRKPRRWGRVGAAVLAVLLVAAAGLTTWLYFHTYQPDQQTNQAAAQAVIDAAKEGTIAALSYSPDSLDKDLDTAKSYLTGDFLTYYSQFTNDVVRPAVKQKQVTTSAEVIRAAVSEMQPDNAKALVFVNQKTKSAERAEPSMTASSVVVTMNKIDGEWLISGFDPI